MSLIARGSLASVNCSPCEPSCTTNCCLPTSIAAFTPPIAVLLHPFTGAPTPPCSSIRARLCAAPSTVRVLLRVLGCLASCFPTASLGPGVFELTHPVLFCSADVPNIQGVTMAKVIFGNHSSVLVPRQDRDSICKFYCDVLGGQVTKADPERDSFAWEKTSISGFSMGMSL